MLPQFTGERTISPRKLDQLEEAVNTALIYREQGSLRLTAAGEVLAHRGQVLLDDAEHPLPRSRLRRLTFANLECFTLLVVWMPWIPLSCVTSRRFAIVKFSTIE